MTVVWIEIRDEREPGEDVVFPHVLTRWRVGHDGCGIGAAHVDIRGGEARFACSRCEWRERVPLTADDESIGEHNAQALRRMVLHREPQPLRLQQVMGGLVELGVASALGQARRVTIAPAGAAVDT